MYTINILSDCVTRDSAELLINTGDIRVMQYPGFFSSMSLNSEKPDIMADESTLLNCGESNFLKRSFILDYNKKALDYLFEKKSDYLMLSFVNNRKKLLKNRGGHFITRTKNAILNNNIVAETLNLKEYDILSPFDILDSEWKKSIENVCDILLRHYTVNQIVYHKQYLVTEYETDDGTLEKLKCGYNIEEMNKFIHFIDDVALEKLRGCHIIEFLDNVTSFSGHWLGIAPLHYNREYYQYSADALKIILKQLPLDEENALLQHTRDIYNTVCKLRYEKLSFKTEINQMQLRVVSNNELIKPIAGSAEDMLRSTNSIRIYLDLLQEIKAHYLIVISVKGTPGSKLPSDVVSKLHELGFKSFSKERGRMYVGASFMSEIICDELGEVKESPVLFHYAKDDLNLKVSSQALKKGNSASIIINDNEYAVNRRGLNIVVYDPQKKILIDSIGLDANNDYWKFAHK